MTSALVNSGPGLEEILTPEGVNLELAVAPAGSRAGAAVLDFLIVLGVSIGLSLLAAVPFPGEWITAVATLAIFLVQNLYFTWFEVRGGGATPGKRQARIRVVDARGGPLRAEAIVTRNLVRNIEVFLPLVVLLNPEAAFPSAPGWAVIIGIVWIVLFALLPLFNRQRRRIGDLIAGTLVVRDPRVFLLTDLGSVVAPEKPEGPTIGATYAFGPGQLQSQGPDPLAKLRNPDLLGNLAPSTPEHS